MSAVLAVQPTATLDEFLADPIDQAELEDVIERLMSAEVVSLGGIPYHSMRVKVREQWSTDGKTRLGARDVSTLILKAWQEHRP